MKIIEPSAVLLPPIDITDPLADARRIELCGRVCYKSEDKITDTSAAAFVENLKKRGHLSVLEHADYCCKLNAEAFMGMLEAFREIEEITGVKLHLRFTSARENYVVSGNMRAWEVYTSILNEAFPEIFRLMEPIIRRAITIFDLFNNTIGNETATRIDPATLTSPIERQTHITRTAHIICDRGVSHEIVRHRLASYSQESTRYCNYAKGKFGGEITVIKPCFWEEGSVTYRAWRGQCEMLESTYLAMIDAGATPQEARSILPNSLKTELMMTANLREWRHFLTLRCAPSAHPQMREIALLLLPQFQTDYPDLFSDILEDGA